jgi:hypothetical protein
MKNEFPTPVPEIPVTDMNQALDYYKHKLGFNIDWGGADGGIAGISKGYCRMSSPTLPFARIVATVRQ